MTEHTYAVIMAGGGGTRLWPISRKETPKQLLPLLGKETLFQSTVARLEKLFPPERILVVTVEEQALVMQEQIPSILESLRSQGVEPLGVTLRKPTLEDVFISLTGRGLRE